MTATCNKTMMDQIELLSGLRSNCSNNIFWPTTDAMQYRNVCVRVSYTSYPLASFKKLVGPALQGSRLQKLIWYANNRVTIERHPETLGTWIGSQGFQPVIAYVTGTHMKEQKLHHTNIIAATNLPNLALLATSDEAARPFNPQMLTATSGAANAGLDSPDVYGVGRAEFLLLKGMVFSLRRYPIKIQQSYFTIPSIILRWL
jgi:hypothetical protein